MPKKFTFVCRNRFGDDPCEIGKNSAPLNQVELEESEIPARPDRPTCPKCDEELHGPTNVSGGGGGKLGKLIIPVVAALIVIGIIIVISKSQGKTPLMSGLPRNVNFGMIEIGSDGRQTMNVRNDGLGILEMGPFQFSDDAFSTEKSMIEVAPESSATIPLKFSPSEDGEFNGTLTFASNDPEFNETTIEISGTGGTLDPWSILDELDTTSTILKP